MNDARLTCFSGEPAPQEILRDYKRFSALPDKAREGLWEILGPSLAGAVDGAMEKRAEAFARLFDVEPSDLQASLRVCRHLLQRAGSLDLSAADFAGDLAKLGGEARASASLLAWYEPAKALVRAAVLKDTIFDHGKVLVGLDYRVDRITGSDRGAGFDAPVALLTLRVVESGREERMTMYVVPEALGQVKTAIERIEQIIASKSEQKARA